jgi:hypothetical protein
MKVHSPLSPLAEFAEETMSFVFIAKEALQLDD